MRAPTGATALELARETANRVIADFTAGKVDRVFVVYNEFKSAISQVTRVKQMLPVVPEKPERGTALVPAGPARRPRRARGPVTRRATSSTSRASRSCSTRLVPLYVQIQLYRAALESIAAFFAAQMTAMENATKNAGEMIARLTLSYNRARQASITKELLEIIGGAEALKG